MLGWISNNESESRGAMHQSNRLGGGTYSTTSVRDMCGVLHYLKLQVILSHTEETCSNLCNYGRRRPHYKKTLNWRVQIHTCMHCMILGAPARELGLAKTSKNCRAFMVNLRHNGGNRCQLCFHSDLRLRIVQQRGR